MLDLHLSKYRIGVKRSKVTDQLYLIVNWFRQRETKLVEGRY